MNSETVKKVADLARLELSTAEVDRFTQQLGKVLEYIDQLSKVDTSSVEPMNSPIEISTPLRPDAIIPSPGSAVMLASAPESLYENYKVPQMMGEKS